MLNSCPAITCLNSTAISGCGNFGLRSAATQGNKRGCKTSVTITLFSFARRTQHLRSGWNGRSGSRYVSRRGSIVFRLP
jgi:hypothetical protein